MDEASIQWWWYLDANGDFAGPVPQHAIVSLFSDGDVDGMTLVHQAYDQASSPPPRASSEWKPVSEVALLRSVLEHREESEASNDSPNDRDDYHLPSPSEMVPPPAQSLVSLDVIERRVIPASEQKNGERNLTDAPNAAAAADREGKRIARKRKRAIARARDRANCTLLVKNVPLDATEREIASCFAKCGILMPDLRSGRPSVVLYNNADGTPTGEAKIIYAMEASVENALLILDGYPLRTSGQPLQLYRTTFDENQFETEVDKDGNANGCSEENPRPAKRNRPPSVPEGLGAVRKDAGYTVLREALGWGDEGQKLGRSIRIVLLKNLFDPNDPNTNYAEVREDLEDGCQECGPIEKITVFEGNREGAAIIKFVDGHGARKCVEVMHQRWYNKRQLAAEFYDGKTDYRVKETEQQKNERLAGWEKWLSGDEDDSGQDNG